MTSVRTQSTYASCEEHIEVLVQQILVDWISEAEVLKELVCKSHHFMHSHITLLYITHHHHHHHHHGSACTISLHSSACCQQPSDWRVQCQLGGIFHTDVVGC